MTWDQMRAAARWSIGYDYFPDKGRHYFPEKGFDGRRRTTKLFKAFSSFANKAVILNSALLLLSYALIAHFFWAPFLPNEIVSFFEGTTMKEHFMTLGRVYLSAQLTVITMNELYKRLVPIVVEDHREAYHQYEYC